MSPVSTATTMPLAASSGRTEAPSSQPALAQTAGPDSSAASAHSPADALATHPKRGRHPLQTQCLQKQASRDRIPLGREASILGLHQQSIAPIQKLSNPEELEAAITQLKNNANKWKPVQISNSLEWMKFCGTTDWDGPERRYMEKLMERYRLMEQYTALMINYFASEKEQDFNSPLIGYVYRIGDDCAGAMLLNSELDKDIGKIIDKDAVQISVLATAPGTEYAACSMVEAAAQYSAQQGKEGNLALIVPNDESFEIYEKMGFIVKREVKELHSKTRYLVLDPSASASWRTDLQGQWRLAHLLDQEGNPKKYLA